MFVRDVWASEHGNADAVQRLSALSQPLAKSLSHQEHGAITETKLVRKHTQARARSETERPQVQSQSQAQGQGGARMDGSRIVGGIRKRTLQKSSSARPAWVQPPPGEGGPLRESRPQYPNAQRYSLVDNGSTRPPPVVVWWCG